MNKTNIFEYKGYSTKIEFDSRINKLRGKIEGINDLVYFESDSALSIEKEFKEAVDDYLILCSENDLEPDKAYRGVFNVRIPSCLHKEISHYAFMNSKTLNASVEEAIKHFIDFGCTNIQTHIQNSINNSLAVAITDNLDTTQGNSTMSTETTFQAYDTAWEN